VAVTGVVISIYYYFGWIRAAFFESGPPPAPGTAPALPAGPAWSGIALLALLASVTILLGIYQQPLSGWLLK
jgi:NADH-quinone oxidoreductase subunit N